MTYTGINPSSLELLERLLPLADRAQILLIALFRPRRQEPSWRFHETAGWDFAHRYQAIFLKPLDPGQSRQLVANLLHVEDLPEQVRMLIMEKAEGNPFFVEEVIRSLLDAGLIVRRDGRWRFPPRRSVTSPCPTHFLRSLPPVLIGWMTTCARWFRQRR